MSATPPELTIITANVRVALEEDVGSGDITARLVNSADLSTARIISRQSAILCGRDWVNEVMRQVDSAISVNWHCSDGDPVNNDSLICELSGNSRSLLTAERTALNFLQLLSGTATVCADYANLVAGTGVQLLDTRKTIPGLRIAQKYAVRCGGCQNHRIGLYDAFLIKENHIAACGSIAQAVDRARAQDPDKSVEVEVETIDELQQALHAGADSMLLDNFNLQTLREAVDITAGKAKLEASGGITRESLREIAETGVDYISIGALTKDCQAVDLSMRFDS